MKQSEVIVHDNRGVLNKFKDREVATVSSIEVAEMVGRRHDQVLRDINNIKGQLGNHTSVESYFVESSYTNSQNKELPCYLLTKKGCELYGTRMTGEKGTQFAVAYIERFNEMEQGLHQDPITLALKAALDTRAQVQTIQDDVDILKNSMRIDGAQEYALSSQGKAKILEVLGGYGSPAYNSISKKVFAQLWRDFKKYFKLPRYSELPKSKFDDGVYFISKWRPETAVEIEIEQING